MATSSVFNHENIKGESVESFCQLLITRKQVSYDDVCFLFIEEEWPTISSHPLYKTTKKVVPEGVSEFVYYGFPVRQIKNGNKTRS